jgi:hypothetical protein
MLQKHIEGGEHNKCYKNTVNEERAARSEAVQLESPGVLARACRIMNRLQLKRIWQENRLQSPFMLLHEPWPLQLPGQLVT